MCDVNIHKSIGEQSEAKQLFTLYKKYFSSSNSASTSQSLQFSLNLTQTSVRETFVAGGYPRPAEGFVAVRCIDSTGVPTSEDVTYNIVDSNPAPFLLNATTGRLSVTADLDYETMTSYNFAVACANISDPNIRGMGMVRIDILPVNEFEPVIMPRSFGTIRLFENTPVGTTILSTEPGSMRQYSVTDRDDGPDGNITFTLSQASPDNTENARFFDLNFFNGALVLRQRLDVDNVPNAFDQVTLRITACDEYPPDEDCPNILVTMFVFSSNDNSPQFSSDTYEASYPESIPVGTPIITAVCTDSDKGAGEFAGIEIYQPASELWRLPNTTSGTVLLNMSLDYETAQMHEFTLRCYDTGGRVDFATVTVNVLPVNVLPVNDAKPVFNQMSYAFTVNRITTPSNDLAIGMVRAVDRDLNGRITYSLEDNENFRITNDGRILLIDYILVLEGNSFNLTVTAHDGEFNATSLVRITVTGLLSAPEIIVLVGLAGVILFVLVVIICCCVTCCCFKRWSR